MKQKSFIMRTVALFLLMAAISATLVTRLVEVQLLAAPQADTRSTTSTRTYAVIAARGELLDREGRPLVANVLGFNVELDYYTWNRQEQNAVILRLCGILDEAGLAHSDELPMTLAPPYAYTFEAWDSMAGRKLEKLIAEQGWDERPAAPQLFGLLCDKYGVDKELLLRDKRTIVGVRYFLDLYQFSTLNNMAVLARDLDIATVAKISEMSLQLPGVSIQEANQRRYETTYAAHILGRVAAISPEEYATLKDADTPYKMTDTLGKDGMEKALEAYLRGVSGKEEVVVSKATGEIVQVTTLPGQEADPGDDCYLTIDLELQKMGEDALALRLEQVRENGLKSKDQKGADVEGGAFAVLNLKTGEVLAMGSYPTYSLATYSQDFADLINLELNPLRPLYNRAAQAAYPPGSTFKMATAVAALESGAATTTETVQDNGPFKYFEDYQPACWIWNQRRGSHGRVNVSDALKYSCNTYFYEMATRMGIATLRDYAGALGLGQKTGIELPGENAGNLDGPETRVQSVNPWHPGNLLAVAIGQGGNQFTPLQLASYLATILNGGTRLEAHLLKKVIDYTGTRTVFEQAPVALQETELKESTVQAIKQGMLDVVTEDGTASSYFRNFPMKVGGKTGSAETRAGRSAHGVFISFAPYDDPEIVVVVIGEHAGTGGSMAPVCIEIYNQYFGLEVPVGLITPDPQPVAPVVTAPATTTPAASGGAADGSDADTDPQDDAEEPTQPGDEATEPTEATDGTEVQGDDGETPPVTEPSDDT